MQFSRDSWDCRQPTADHYVVIPNFMAKEIAKDGRIEDPDAGQRNLHKHLH
jgi:hypothetical protein